MSRMVCFVLLVIFSNAGLCQHTLKGKVVDAANKKPVTGTSVYINNSFTGTYTNDQGEFLLRNAPEGIFRLVISHVGYETVVEIIDTRELKENYLVSLKIIPDELKEVVIKGTVKNGWHKWGELFTSSFIGNSRYAGNCSILNKEAIHFVFSQQDNMLKAMSREPLEIENRSLGYKITINLTAYSYNFNNHYLYYEFFSRYDYLVPDDEAELRRWRNNRKEVYYGSLMHFFRSLFDSSWEKEGFEVRKFGKPRNAEFERIRDSIAANTSLLKAITGNIESKQRSVDPSLPSADTLHYYKSVILAYSSSDQLFPALLKFSQFGEKLDSNAILLKFDHYLHITYTKKREPVEYAMATGKYRPGQQMIRGRLNSQASYDPDNPRSTLQLAGKVPVQVYYNGNFSNIDLLIDGYWSWWQKVATMLPFDYKPD